jgi:hypothetical protein
MSDQKTELLFGAAEFIGLAQVEAVFLLDWQAVYHIVKAEIGKLVVLEQPVLDLVAQDQCGQTGQLVVDRNVEHSHDDRGPPEIEN